MYEKIILQTYAWMPDQHTYELSDVPGGIQMDMWQNKCSDRYMDRGTDAQMYQQMYRHTDMPKTHPYVCPTR